MLRQVSVIGFQLMRRSGASGVALGMNRLDRKPSTASRTTAPATNQGPRSGMAISTPPSKVPIRMARKVPISTQPLPPTSSSGRRCWGKMLYFTGPNRVDCQPIRNSNPISTDMLPRMKPSAAHNMMTISSSLIQRIRCDFSYLSASWPAVAENRKNGNTNKPALRLTRVLARAGSAAWKAIRMIRAFLNTLSLNAPRNWVMKNGRNRRSFSKVNSFPLAMP